MVFEFDSRKSALNKQKHGIDFIEAQELWRDNNADIFSFSEVNNEERELVIGKINNKVWVAVIHSRNGSTRIISVRRARKKEEKLYYDK